MTQARVLAGWIAATGRNLTTVYVTHGHGDHHFGLSVILDRFPEARAVAAPAVVEHIREAVDPQAVASFWAQLLPGQIPDRLVVAEPLTDGRFDLEGHDLVVVGLGHTNTDDTTCLHVPDIGLVVAGDAVYNDDASSLGCFPDGLGWRFIPVDVVARDIVSCLLSPASTNHDIYLDSKSLLSPELMVETLRRSGFDVRVVPYAAWRRKVLALAATADTRNALFPFTDVIYALTPLRFLGQRYQFEWCLENRGCPDEIRALLEPREHIQPSVVSHMVDYYVRAGAMPPLR